MSNNVTRTFVIPESKLPAQFGLTETVGTMPAERAKAFVEEIRHADGRLPGQGSSAPRWSGSRTAPATTATSASGT